MKVMQLDVTDEQSTENCYNVVKQYLDENAIQLWAIINNAGIFTGGAIELGKLREFERCFAVNSLGVIRITRTFLPLIRRSKGRIICVDSFAGRISFAGLASYSISKYAVSAFTDALRREMHRFGVKVITIEPSLYK